MTDKEEYLELPGGRTLAYAHGGNPSSKQVVIFLHGVFGVGRVTRLPPVFVEKGVHFIAPTLPGWGNSSLPRKSTTFHDYLYQATTALITHLHPDTNGLKLYIGGGSYGTIAAQMLYGASYHVFPLGRHIAGLLLLAAFSPPRVHRTYAKCLSWSNYIAIGPPSRYLPTLQLGKLMMKNKVNTPERAVAFIHDFGFKKMTPKEREAYERFMQTKGLEEGQMEKEIGENAYRSVANTWEGFLTVADVFQSDWGGYDPTRLDEEHARKPVLVVMTKEDLDNTRMGEWLVKNMPNAHGRYEEGGHMAALFVLDDIWVDFLNRCS
ncbi:unnamed protein product [Somion occarium]|uniref:AB hydrolase-1 domain-containing protein n=1 Tax=Somion occarium TaxID=3059160 RepID=A0ABP1D3G1_9APHY